jgi:AraC-like DNA-binding protein
MTTGRVDHVPLVVPLPARPKQLLTFFLADRYCVHHPASAQRDAHPRAVVVGPQTQNGTALSVLGCIDNFTIHFQPAGFNQLFGFPMAELTDAVGDAQAVIGCHISSLQNELGDTPGFAERVLIVEKHLLISLAGRSRRDPVAGAANRLFASHGRTRVSAMAAAAGLSLRHFERRFVAQVGVPPKLYARIIRFNAALDGKLRSRARAWAHIAQDQDYYDQMHLLRDCRDFTGQSPSRFLAQLEALPEFHTLFAAENHAHNG